MVDPAAQPAAGEPEAAAPPVPATRPPEALLADPRALAARVRTDLHRLLGALARKDYEDAVLALRPPLSPGDAEWTPDRIASAMSAFYEDHGRILTTPDARHPKNTFVTPVGDRQWTVEQKLLDAEGHDDWAIHATVDLTAGVPTDGPIIHLDRLGV
jgi:hypothetical protein